MRLRTLIALLAALCLALPVAAMANGNGKRNDHPKITGGGQVFLAEDGEASVGPGPGDTVAFTVHAESYDEEEDQWTARGQYRRIQRDGAGPPSDKFFGIVTCVEFFSEDEARFGGYERLKGNQPSGEAFTVEVRDNGQGGDSDDDLIIFHQGIDNPCDEEEDDDPLPEWHLARGNLKIHNNPYSAPEEE